MNKLTVCLIAMSSALVSACQTVPPARLIPDSSVCPRLDSDSFMLQTPPALTPIDDQEKVQEQ
jgi:hypothetical protein